MIYVEHIARDVHFSSIGADLFERKHIEMRFLWGVRRRSARARIFCRLLFFLSLSLSKCFVFFLCLCAGGEMSPLSLSLSLSLSLLVVINLVVLLLLTITKLRACVKTKTERRSGDGRRIPVVSRRRDAKRRTRNRKERGGIPDWRERIHEAKSAESFQYED
jgi:hypothetical protein